MADPKQTGAHTPYTVGWGKGLTGPNMSTLATKEFRGLVPISQGDRLIAAVPVLEDADLPQKIVRAVNSHALLVEALEAVVNAPHSVDSCGRTCPRIYQKDYAKIEAALRAAKGE